MGFFDGYTSTAGGGKYISSDEKQVLIDNGVSFDITALVHEPENKYGPRYVAFVTVPNPEAGGEPLEAKIGFPTDSGVDSRDNMLRAMDSYFSEDGAEPVNVKLTKQGRAIQIVPGS